MNNVKHVIEYGREAGISDYSRYSYRVSGQWYLVEITPTRCRTLVIDDPPPFIVKRLEEWERR